MSKADFKVGDQVYFGRPNGQQTLGTIIKLNLKTAKIRTLESRGYRQDAEQMWNVAYPLMRISNDTVTLKTPFASPIPSPTTTINRPLGRGDETIMQAILNTYCDLSPENLSCDGELSFSQVNQRRRVLETRLKGLFQAIGRNVLEEEAYDWDSKRSVQQTQSV